MVVDGALCLKVANGPPTASDLGVVWAVGTLGEYA